MLDYYFGFGARKCLTDVLEKISARKIFLVTGSKSYQASGAEEMLAEILKPYSVRIFSGFSANTKYEEALPGLLMFREFSPDVMLAVGGGSVIDMAKLIRCLASNPENTLAVAKGEIKLSDYHLPLLAMPTTAGTGSEATRFAVFYINNQKYSLADEKILPDVAIIDPELTLSMDHYTTAASGFDALAQAIESYWATSSTEESRVNSANAIKLAWKNLVRAVHNPDDEAREAMSKAAFLAGVALDTTRSTLPHALCYVLTTDFGLAHGHAVAVCLAPFFKLHSDEKLLALLPEDKRNYLTRTMREIADLLGCKEVADCCDAWRVMMKKCWLSSTFIEAGVKTEADREKIINAVNLARAHLHPMPFDRETLYRIFSC